MSTIAQRKSLAMARRLSRAMANGTEPARRKGMARQILDCLYMALNGSAPTDLERQAGHNNEQNRQRPAGRAR